MNLQFTTCYWRIKFKSPEFKIIILMLVDKQHCIGFGCWLFYHILLVVLPYIPYTNIGCFAIWSKND